MNYRNPRSAVRLGMLPAGIAIALAPAFAGAQEQADEGATPLDRIEVTGSRIRGADMETQQPIITIGREQLQQQGFVSVADVLQNLTSAGSPAIARSEALASGENVGGYYVDIRNLGAQRTLVLMNGKRLGATTSGLQDLSQMQVDFAVPEQQISALVLGREITVATEVGEALPHWELGVYLRDPSSLGRIARTATLTLVFFASALPPTPSIALTRSTSSSRRPSAPNRSIRTCGSRSRPCCSGPTS